MLTLQKQRQRRILVLVDGRFGLSRGSMRGSNPESGILLARFSIREHSLLQAIARVNRRHSQTRDGVTTEKTYGLVVDYHGVSRELKSALAIFERGDIEEALTELPEDPGPVIQAAADRAEAHFRGLDIDDP